MLFFFVCFLRQGLVYPLLAWNSTLRPGWPQRSYCLCFLSAEIKGSAWLLLWRLCPSVQNCVILIWIWRACPVSLCIEMPRTDQGLRALQWEFHKSPPDPFPAQCYEKGLSAAFIVATSAWPVTLSRSTLFNVRCQHWAPPFSELRSQKACELMVVSFMFLYFVYLFCMTKTIFCT